MQSAEVWLGLASLAGLAVWAWPALAGWVDRIGALGLPAWMLPERILPLPQPAGRAAGFVLVTLLLGGMLLACVHRALADE
jgi:hypothetical protein